MDVRRRGVQVNYHLGGFFNRCVNLVPEVGFVVLLRPASVDVFLSPLVGLVEPQLGTSALLDHLILLPGVALLARFDKGAVDDHVAAGQDALIGELVHMVREKMFQQFGFCENFSVLPDDGA